MKKTILFLMVLTSLPAPFVAAANLYERFKDAEEIRVYLEKVTSETEDPRANPERFRGIFKDTLPERVNINFKEVSDRNSADVAIYAKIKKYDFAETAIPMLFSMWSVIADTSAPKSSAKLSVDYLIVDPSNDEVLSEFIGFTIRERRPKDDMKGDKAFFHAAAKNINRFLYRAFYKQRSKQPFVR